MQNNFSRLEHNAKLTFVNCQLASRGRKKQILSTVQGQSQVADLLSISLLFKIESYLNINRQQQAT